MGAHEDQLSLPDLKARITRALGRVAPPARTRLSEAFQHYHAAAAGVAPEAVNDLFRRILDPRDVQWDKIAETCLVLLSLLPEDQLRAFQLRDPDRQALLAALVETYHEMERHLPAGPALDHALELEDLVPRVVRAAVIDVQDALPVSQRKELSVYFTSFRYADLLAEWGVAGTRARVLDPTCGGGVFLHAVLQHVARAAMTGRKTGNEKSPFKEGGEAPSTLHLTGVEIHPLLAFFADLSLHVVHACLPKVVREQLTINITILCQDFLTGTGGDAEAKSETSLPHLHDVILMNPPYTSLERLPRAYVRHVKRQIQERGLAAYIKGRGMGLHQYILLAVTAWLTPGGRIAMVLPGTFVNLVDSTGAVEYLLDEYHVTHVISPTTRGAISTHSEFSEILVLATKRPGTPDQENPSTRFLELPGNLAGVELTGVTEREGNQPALDPHSFPPGRPVEATELRAKLGAWNQFFRGVPVLDALQARAGTRLQPGNHIFRRAREGLRPLGSHVFYLPNKYWRVCPGEADAAAITIQRVQDADASEPTPPVPPELVIPRMYLEPVVRSPRVNDGALNPVIRHFFLHISAGDDRGVAFGVREYLRWYANCHPELVPRSRKDARGRLKPDWYLRGDFTRIQPVHVAVLEKFLPTSKAQVAQFLTPPCFPVGAYYFLQGFTRSPRNSAEAREFWQVIVAWYNSTPGLVLRYKFRQVLGKASERVLARHLEAHIPCLVPWEIEADARAALVSWMDKNQSRELPAVAQQVGTPARDALDARVLQAVGYQGDEIPVIRSRLQAKLTRWCEEIRAR